MKCNATVAVVGKIMAYETCGIGLHKILIRIRHCHGVIETRTRVPSDERRAERPDYSVTERDVGPIIDTYLLHGVTTLEESKPA